MTADTSPTIPSISVDPVPADMHTVTPHLVCAGASAAIDFYQKAFGAVELTRLEMPDGKIMNAAIRIGDSMLMLVDEMPDWKSFGPKSLGGTPVSIHLQVPDADALFAQAVAAGAEPKMPVTEMFWGDRFGMVKDPWGHSWSMGTRVKNLTQEEIAAAAAGASCGEGCCD